MDFKWMKNENCIKLERSLAFFDDWGDNPSIQA